MNKIPVILKPAYTGYFERTQGLTFAHIDIHQRWTPTIKAALLEDWQRLRELHSEEPIFAVHTPGNRTQRKFFFMFGFQPLGTFVREDGSEREIFVIGA